MSFLDLYMNGNPLITSPSEEVEPSTIMYGVPFDSTHSYRPGTRFGPDAIREAFNNIEIFMPQFSVDLESVNIEDLGNTKETGYIVFDAHYDLRDEYADTKLSHAAYLRRIIEKQGSDRIIHVGARSYVKEELAYDLAPTWIILSEPC